jgi:phage tail sheath protein FI
MPASLSYPGVYIEELQSAVHTITGVATSIAAFIGWAPQGPADRASLVESWADYQTQFGGLDSRSYLGYSVNHFFANGGQQAYIVRLVGTDAATASNGTVGGTLALFARNPGAWGKNITIAVTTTNATPPRFGLQILYSGTVVENFVNLSIDPGDPQFVMTVINNDSQYVAFTDSAGNSTTPTALPTATSTAATMSGGADGAVLHPNDDNFEKALEPNATPGSSLLDRVGIFNLLCVPGETVATTIQNLQKYCFSKRAFYIVDAPQTATYTTLLSSGPAGSSTGSLTTAQNAGYSAYYFPWILAPDPLAGNRPTPMPPSGYIAGIYATTDASRGVWKAPAGIDAGLTGSLGLQYVLTDKENGDLNAQGINCLRHFNVYGDVVWGARTLLGNDQAGSQWKYVPVRRLALFIESSLYDGTQWVVFEPNNESLWSQIRLNAGAFLQGLFLQGAFQGTSPQQAYFVKCDSENNPQSSINLGIVNVLVGFAPLYPAEFVVIQIQQIAGQL